jgi:Bacterial archaeo-eukaryotic release factor family 3
MNRVLLDELQRQRAYPSVTLLMNTTPGVTLDDAELGTAHGLVALADERLEGDVDDSVRIHLISVLRELIDARRTERSGHALALCVSPAHSSAVSLGRCVEERVVIDDTFATRDLVADLNRTARYRVVTVSDRTTRLLLGDRQRLVEQRDDTWPMERDEQQNSTSWTREVARNLRVEHIDNPLPTVVAGVQRSARQIITQDMFDTIGFLPGNHDRSTWMQLHNAAWPLVTDWLRTDHRRAIEQLDEAMSANRYAGGINEIWPLANEGLVHMLVVEDGYSLPARIDANNQLVPADDRDHPDVNDDVVDDTIEAVLRHGGATVIVNNGTLPEHQRIAAVLRY